jgi:hypothetical protein
MADPPLLRDWPLRERARQFELGCIVHGASDELAQQAVRQVLGNSWAGWWECELAGNQLTWTAGVYNIFGLPQCAGVERAAAVSLYCEESRAIMERLRDAAITRRQSFVLDAKVRPASGAGERWMRLLAAPVLADGQVVRLEGLKLVI